MLGNASDDSERCHPRAVESNTESPSEGARQRRYPRGQQAPSAAPRVAPPDGKVERASRAPWWGRLLGNASVDSESPRQRLVDSDAESSCAVENGGRTAPEASVPLLQRGWTVLSNMLPEPAKLVPPAADDDDERGLSRTDTARPTAQRSERAYLDTPVWETVAARFPWLLGLMLVQSASGWVIEARGPIRL